MSEVIDSLYKGYSHADRDAETSAFMGGGISIGDIEVPPPTPGVQSQLEMLDSPFVNAGGIDVQDVALAVWLLKQRSSDAMKNPEGLADIGSHLLAMLQESPKDYYNGVDALVKMFEMAGRGFDLVPPSNDPRKEPEHHRQFDATWLAFIVSIGVKMTNRTDTEILWNTPMASLGFYFAQLAIESGEKGVGRQLDYKSALELLRKKRDTEGNDG
jgi:hypothetical protein